MGAYFFDGGQLLDRENNNIGEEEELEDVELKGIHVATWEKKDGLLVVPREHRLEVRHQHHDCQVAGHLGKH